MFFSKLKKSNKPKKGLPENLLELQDSMDTVWVWDPDYNMLVWANDIGMDFWKAKSRIELKELVFPQFHPMMQVSSEALAAVKKNGSFITGLSLVTYPEEITYDCHFTLQMLPDGREGLLVTIPHGKKNEQSDYFDLETPQQGEEALELMDLSDDSDLASLEANGDMSDMDHLDITDDELNINTPAQPEQTPEEVQPPTAPEAQAEQPQMNAPQILVDETVFTTPLTISVHENGFLLGADERTNFFIQANPQTRFEHLLTNPIEAESIIHTALQSEQNSFITRLTVQAQDLPFVVQTFSLEHEGQRILNVAMLRITDEQYSDHITTIQDAQQVNDAHENQTILTEEKIENTEVIVEEVTETQAIAAPSQQAQKPEASLISDSTTTAMFDTNGDGLILDCNNMSKTLTGLFRDDLLGRHISALFDENTAQNIIHFMQHNQTDSGEYVDGAECYFHGENNTNRHGIVVIRPAPRAAGGFLFLLTDNTEVQNIKKDLNALKEGTDQEATDVATEPEVSVPVSDPAPAPQETTQSVAPVKTESTAAVPAQDKIVPDYLAHISHELRAPLNAISGYTELLKSEAFGAIDPQYMDYIRSLDIASHHAKEVVDDLLDFAKLEAGGFTAHIDETDLSDVIEKAIVLVKPQATFRNIELKSTLFTGTPNIKADARLLRQAISNILSNAIKYSDENEDVHIAVGLTKTKRLMIEITNFGAGMTEEQIETAMQPYGRLEGDKNIKGTGLGLPLAKRFTELMGGHFLIHSVPKEKTRVRIIFEEDKVIQ